MPSARDSASRLQPSRWPPSLCQGTTRSPSTGSPHHGVWRNETADEMAKAVAEGNHPDDAVPDEPRWGTSLSHMARVATGNRSRMTAGWISSRTGDPRRRYRPPRGRGLRHRLLRRTPKSIAGRYYQLLSGRAAIGPYLKDKIRKTDDDRCGWCRGRGWAGPAGNVTSPFLSWGGRDRLFFSFLLFVYIFPLFGGYGEKEIGAPY